MLAGDELVIRENPTLTDAERVTQLRELIPLTTDLADWLVRTLKMPFRDAHHVTGSLVALAETEGCDLPDLPLKLMQSVEPRITRDVYKVLTVENSVASRTSYGGTAPKNVRKEARRWLKLLKT